MLLSNLRINKIIMNKRKYSNKCLQEGKMAKFLQLFPSLFPKL